MRLLLLCFATTLISSVTLASVEVAFIEMRTPNGKILELEKGGRFAHLAISFQNQWLHAHPFYGVEFADEARLQRIGQIREIVSIRELAELSEETIAKFLGKRFDSEYSWSDEKMYCSELVGKLLAIPPRPMDFSAKIWPERYRKLNGLPGLSPDAIYRSLKSRGYPSQTLP